MQKTSVLECVLLIEQVVQVSVFSIEVKMQLKNTTTHACAMSISPPWQHWLDCMSLLYVQTHYHLLLVSI